MTKADLVEQVADVTGRRVTKRDCGLVVDAFLDAVKETLARGDYIEIRGFGTFKVRHRKARTARNPKTGEPVEVPTACCAGLQAVESLPQPGGPGLRNVRGGRAIRGRRWAIGPGRRRDGAGAGS